MTLLVPIVMFGWIPFTILLFTNLSPQRATVISVIGGFLFLPVAVFNFPGIPSYDKFSTISISLFLGALLSGQMRRYRFRFTLYDVPMFLWCFISPIITSLSNDLGLYNGLSSSMIHLLNWGIFYWTGRRFFGTPDSLRVLTRGTIIGALIYIPLILFELRMSPQLSNIVYGFFPHSFLQHIRYGGWRPIVFTPHGLSLAFFMASSTTFAIWLWRSGEIKRTGGVSLGFISCVLLVITILCKSANAWFYLIVGITALAYYRRTGSALFLTWAMLAIMAYLAVRITNVITIDQVRDFASRFFDPERIDSLYFRLRQEDLFGERSFLRPLFGWGGYRRGWPINPITGGDLLEVVDALWVIALNENGFLGLVSLYLAMGFGPWRVAHSFMKQCNTGLSIPGRVDAITLSLVVAYFLIDSLLNGGTGYLFTIFAGALTSYYLKFLRDGIITYEKDEEALITVSQA